MPTLSSPDDRPPEVLPVVTGLQIETMQPTSVTFAAAATLAGLDPWPGGAIDGTTLRSREQQARAALMRRGERAVIAIDASHAALLREHGEQTTITHGERAAVVAAFTQLVRPEDGGARGHRGDELAAATVADRRWQELAAGAGPTRGDAPIVRRAARAAQRTGVSELLVVASRTGRPAVRDHVAWTFDHDGWLRIESSDIEAADGGVELLVSPWPAASRAFFDLLEPLAG